MSFNPLTGFSEAYYEGRSIAARNNTYIDAPGHADEGSGSGLPAPFLHLAIRLCCLPSISRSGQTLGVVPQTTCKWPCFQVVGEPHPVVMPHFWCNTCAIRVSPMQNSVQEWKRQQMAQKFKEGHLFHFPIWSCDRDG